MIFGSSLLDSSFIAYDCKPILLSFGDVHKRLRNQGMWVYPLRTFFRQGEGGWFRCGRPHFLVQKTSNFLN